MKRSQRHKLMKRCAERDGHWECHYCKCRLVPIDEIEKYVTRGSFVDSDGQLVEYWTLVLPPHLQYPTLDHKVPKSKGGKDNLGNLVLSCRSCNAKKGYRHSYQEFFQGIQVGI